MSLNIKNPETHRLVRELATATGVSQTAAVEDAVRRRLAEVRQGSDEARGVRLEKARAIAQAFRADLNAEDAERIRTADQWLYDEDGLPA
ncbi:MAG: type II toxin-antitoxin system VapB family antitoxin [Propionibacteriaceae bacterium]|nr:type II toxin-antitoxin system VapB family antitoxin [Propionibacteriaceae bacterium]